MRLISHIGISNQLWFYNISVNVYGFRLSKVKNVFVDMFTVEERQLAGFIIVSAKSSISLYSRAGK